MGAAITHHLASIAGTSSTVGSLFRARAQVQPTDIALVCGARQISYRELLDRVERLAEGLAMRGVQRGDRIALLSRNRPEYIEITLAAGMLGAITACLNWRLSPRELAYCIELVSPKMLIGESDLLATLGDAASNERDVLTLDVHYESCLRANEGRVPIVAQPEDGLVILYTSGTTGLPKGAVISHRAMIARALVFTSDLSITPEEGFVAWAPLFHMVSTDHSLATLLRGGTVVIVDGFRPDLMLSAIAQYRIGWFVLIPGMIDALIDALRDKPTTVKGINVCGAMADLVPAHALAEITSLLGAPYLNTFGSTETGLPPASRSVVPAGTIPERLSKRQSAFCEIRLVDADGEEVADGSPGELAMRGPTLFSGYWQADETNALDFRDGWFHMGDVFRRNVDGTLDFVDRAKYMIKSGGENVYPAEIERVLLTDPRVTEAAVVRAPDTKWGEVPVVFVARRDETLSEADLLTLCRANLAGYKRPREVRFLTYEDFPRSTSGKVQRHALERMLSDSIR